MGVLRLGEPPLKAAPLTQYLTSTYLGVQKYMISYIKIEAAHTSASDKKRERNFTQGGSLSALA